MSGRPTPMPNGTRVRHGGEQYPRAYLEGTANIVGHFWIGDHLEYRIMRDKPRFTGGPLEGEWAYYHTHRVDPV